jgi:lipoprotein-releasing system permease protein
MVLGFELRVAVRHLVAGRGQTALTISTVGAGVVVIVFITSLIFGVQKSIAEMLTDMLPHVTVSPPDLEPRSIKSFPGAEAVAAKLERQNPQRKYLDNWQSVSASISRMPHVKMVAPAVMDQAFVSRGGKQVGAMVFGADPESLDGVTRVRKYIIQGHYLGLGSDECVITYKLGKELSVTLGDRIRLASNQNRFSSFRVVGVYDTGSDEDVYKVYITLRSAQSLYGTGRAVQSILVKADNLFNADLVADQIASVFPYKAKSWSRQYPQFVSTLSVQGAVAYLISAFSLITAAFAIASVLIVSVLQRGKQIGILKSMGAKQAQIFRVFLLEGLGIAVVGAIAGAAGGCGLVLMLQVFKRPVSRPDAIPEALFPTQLTWTIVGIAMLAAIISTVIAAALPARRAAGMDPVQVMK